MSAPEYDSRRGSARSRGYTAEWDRISKVELRLYPLCLGCTAVGRVAAASLRDHIIPHKGDKVLFWDPKNRQSSCKWHHDEIKQRLETLFAQGNATAADLCLDSAMAKALTIRLGNKIGIDGFPLTP